MRTAAIVPPFSFARVCEQDKELNCQFVSSIDAVEDRRAAAGAG